MAKHARSTQNNKCAVSLQHLKKELSYEVDILHVDTHKILLQVDTSISERACDLCSKYPGKFAMSL